MPLSNRKPWCGVFRSGGIGDSLIASSAVAMLSKQYHVEVLCDAPWGCMWENDPHVAKLTELPADTLPKDQTAWNDWMRLRSREYDRFVNLSHTCEVALAFQVIQSCFDWNAQARRKWCDRSYLEHAHDVAGVEYDFNIGPRFYPTADEINDAYRVKSDVGSRVIGIPISGSRLDKVWPWLPQFCAKVLRDLEVPIILFGSPTEKDASLVNRVGETVELQNGDRNGLHCCISKNTEELKVDWSVRRNLAQIMTCDMVISPDTGLAWAVAMQEMPKIVLLSHASPTNITKHWVNTTTLHADQKRVPCWPCHQLHQDHSTCTKAEKVDASACISDIHDTVVLDLVRREFGKRPSSVPLIPVQGYVGLRRNSAA
jgi:ADP-heptose:LPS heptosyltransferase